MWVLWQFPKVYSLWHCSLGIPEDVGALEIPPGLLLAALCSLYSIECGCYGKTSLSTPWDTIITVYQKTRVHLKNFKFYSSRHRALHMNELNHKTHLNDAFRMKIQGMCVINQALYGLIIWSYMGQRCYRLCFIRFRS